ncbi:hypothetical protein RUM44_007984 [Polyplax serrata]|uniref:ZP domain-containing protein n=1 Tax=Polyplax serrata TaxID=468196 RepID=A0ABR1BB53_POLSC
MVFLFQLVSGQLLQSKDEIEEINALQDFGVRRSHLKADDTYEGPELHAIFGDEKVHFARNGSPKGVEPLKRNSKKTIPGDKKGLQSPRTRYTVAQISEEDGFAEKDTRGTVEIVSLGDHDGGRTSSKKFSKKVTVNSESFPFLPRLGGPDKEPMTDVPGYTNIARRNQRQSHMEEMAHSHLKDIMAECGDTGISVELDFNEPFDGVVYSKGYYNDPQCT